MEQTRRAFAKTVGRIGGITALGTQVPSVHASAETTLTGQVLYSDGSPAANDIIYISGNQFTYTDERGYFEKAVGEADQYRLCYYKGHQPEGTWQQHPPIQDGAPQLYGLGRYQDEELGEITLPEAHVVNVRVVDTDGEPITDARPDFRHEGFGADHRRLTTDEDGWVLIEDAEFTGFELVGDVTVTMAPPEDDDRFPSQEVEREITVSEDIEVTFVFGENGLEEFEAPDAAERDTTDSDTVEREDTSTESNGTTDQAATGNKTNEQPPDSRGFFSNDDGPVNLLSDPLFLTVSGFVLSVVGITTQLLRGR